jgi:hypothetical protein
VISGRSPHSNAPIDSRHTFAAVANKKSSVIITYHDRWGNSIISFCLKSRIFFKGDVLLTTVLSSPSTTAQWWTAVRIEDSRWKESNGELPGVVKTQRKARSGSVTGFSYRASSLSRRSFAPGSVRSGRLPHLFPPLPFLWQRSLPDRR